MPTTRLPSNGYSELYAGIQQFYLAGTYEGLPHIETSRLTLSHKFILFTFARTVDRYR